MNSRKVLQEGMKVSSRKKDIPSMKFAGPKGQGHTYRYP